ncbi:MAG TPA: hypothetical protein VGL89_08010 [Candidatus Koribacter sp.]
MNATPGMPPTATTPALHALLASLIDYAGLFPPAGLDMETAVSNYARYKTGPYAWMLGRFVVPVARLEEFETAWLWAKAPAGWKLSALVAKLEELEAVKAFNAKQNWKVEIDAVELKAGSVADIHEVNGVTAYVEVPSNVDPTHMIAAMAHENLRAKIRTGGLTADAFPQVTAVARFLRACAGAHIPFKATAGLHHPVRCMKPFTYKPDSPKGTMHGFLNVFLAAAMVRRGYANMLVEQVLAEENPRAFQFSDDAVRWRDAQFSSAELTDVRTNFAIAFGSCSFEDPITDLQALGLLP